MTDHFSTALKFSLRWEGGYVNDPDDRGGATYRGVTQRVYDAFRRALHRATRSVKYLTDDELHTLYRRDYWTKAGCDRIAYAPLAIAVFDFAVNSGVSRAVTFLQSELRDHLVIAIDGQFGPQTARHVALVIADGDGPALTADYIAARESFLRGIAKGRQRKFLKGWLNRVRDLRAYVATVPS